MLGEMGSRLESPKATQMIEKAAEAVSWLPELERICVQMNPEETDSDRLWRASMRTAQFPTLLLQSAVRLTKEPPKGLPANVLGSTKCDDPIAHDRLVFSASSQDSLPGW